MILTTRTGLHFSYQLISYILMGLCLTLGLTLWGGYRFAYWQMTKDQHSLVGEWQQYLQRDRRLLHDLESHTEQNLRVLTQHIGRMEADLTRLNALGERLVQQAHLNPQEFDFSFDKNSFHADAEMQSILKKLDAQLSRSFIQMNAVHQALQIRLGQRELTLTGEGKPVSGGWVSSFFGSRADPFNGHQAWHAGVDIAGKEGAEVKALATGIVSFANENGGYGRMVEINHGNGLATRYGHNKKLLVQSGQLVKKGQTIALLGSSGRSTGPHVHLEVHKDGKAVDPGQYFSDLRRKA